jgi:hypothetical protein
VTVSTVPINGFITVQIKRVLYVNFRSECRVSYNKIKYVRKVACIKMVISTILLQIKVQLAYTTFRIN